MNRATKVTTTTLIARPRPNALLDDGDGVAGEVDEEARGRVSGDPQDLLLQVGNRVVGQIQQLQAGQTWRGERWGAGGETGWERRMGLKVREVIGERNNRSV